MELLLEIGLGHLRQRLRQTLVSVGGVALGVGFYIAVAALMQGSQDDFVQELVNSMPHITVKDEFRDPTVQPAERRSSSTSGNLSRSTATRRARNPWVWCACGAPRRSVANASSGPASAGSGSRSSSVT